MCGADVDSRAGIRASIHDLSAAAAQRRQSVDCDDLRFLRRHGGAVQLLALVSRRLAVELDTWGTGQSRAGAVIRVAGVGSADRLGVEDREGLASCSICDADT